MKTRYLLALAALLVSASFSTIARAETTAEEFVNKASIGGKFEIDSSKVALERSSNADVKAFAQKMIDDHSKADEALIAKLPEAKVSDINVAKALDKKHQEKLDDLKKTKAEDFDKDYIKAQEDAHDEAVSLFKDYSKDGKNTVLKDFATKTLPTLEEHHDKVDSLKDQVK